MLRYQKKKGGPPLMCRISTLLLADTTYRGIIVRMQLGHIFYPFDVSMRVDGSLVPKTGLLNPEHNWFLRFHKFKQTLSDAISMSSSTEPSQFVEDFHGDKIKLRERILELNKQAGLPGFKDQTALAA